MNALAKLAVVGGLLAVSAPNFAQKATPEQMGPYANRGDMGMFHMQTKLGSFKMINGEGRVDFSFKGTLLVSHHTDGEMRVVSGNLRKEYSKNNRTVYTGQARVILTGKWRGIQWFGSDLTAVKYGKGFVRVSGEFDRNMQTGFYWYEDPAAKNPFPASSVISLAIPPPEYGANRNIKPTPRKGGAAGGN
ncbi:hypothetical protein CCB80_10075 [Armatimonadetes bacterium Uphvl-Ar1]|nr:hypothetical protein CCB80_10075 [Armatimonadetes bacterium Uphvl-Ar1]